MIETHHPISLAFILQIFSRPPKVARPEKNISSSVQNQSLNPPSLGRNVIFIYVENGIHSILFSKREIPRKNTMSERAEANCKGVQFSPDDTREEEFAE